MITKHFGSLGAHASGTHTRATGQTTQRGKKATATQTTSTTHNTHAKHITPTTHKSHINPTKPPKRTARKRESGGLRFALMAYISLAVVAVLGLGCVVVFASADLGDTTGPAPENSQAVDEQNGSSTAASDPTSTGDNPWPNTDNPASNGESADDSDPAATDDPAAAGDPTPTGDPAATDDPAADSGMQATQDATAAPVDIAPLASSVEVATEAALRTAISGTTAADDPLTITLTADIQLTDSYGPAPLVIPADRDISLRAFHMNTPTTHPERLYGMDGQETVQVYGKLSLVAPAMIVAHVDNPVTPELGRGAHVFSGGIFVIAAGGAENNVADKGAGVYVESGGSLTILNGGVAYNTAYDSGGGVYVAAGGQFDISVEGKVEYNVSEGPGGGVYNSGSMTITGKTTIAMNQSSGYGAGVYNEGSFTMAEDSRIVMNTSSSSCGGGMYNTGSFTMTDGSILSNHCITTLGTGCGGGVYNTGSFTMTNGTISYSRTDGEAGGVMNASGTFAMSGNAKIYLNTTANQGGGVSSIGSTASFTMSDNAQITQNSATGVEGHEDEFPGFGGGIYCEDSTVTLSGNAQVDNNSAHNGGGIYLTDSTCNLTQNTTVHNNTAELRGGGVHIDRSTCNLTQDTALYNNTAKLTGGGVYIAGGTCSMADACAVYQNTAEDKGGGFYATGGTLTISGGFVLTNQATTGGGGVVVGANSKLTLSNVDISNNQVTGSPGYEDVYPGMGGGILSAASTVTLGSNTKLVDNSAGIGGGIYMVQSTCNLTQNTTLQNNTASQHGGGVYMDGITTCNVTDACSVSNNNATDKGGGFYVNAGVLNISGGSVLSNKAASGGGVAVAKNGSCTITNSWLSENTSKGTASGTGGGGVFVEGQCQLSGLCEISKNTAVNRGGGVFVANGGSCVVQDDTLIWNNRLPEEPYVSAGGGVYVASGGALTMQGGTIKANYASMVGGGVYLEGAGSTFTMTGGLITGNTVGFLVPSGSDIADPGHGSAVYVNQDAAFTMSGGEISDHIKTAVTNEGTFYLLGSALICDNPTTAVKSSGAFVMSNGQIVRNGDPVGDYFGAPSGGGVYTNGHFEMSGGVISDNEANYGGGGVYVSRGDFLMSGGLISNNKVTYYGGGVYLVGADAQFVMSDAAQIEGNRAAFGGGVCANYGSMQLTGGLIKDNVAAPIMVESADGASEASLGGYGGGVFIGKQYDGSFVMDGGRLEGNVAFSGGGLYCDSPSALIEVLSGSIVGNVAEVDDDDDLGEGSGEAGGAGLGQGSIGGNGGGIWMTDTNLGLERLTVAAGVVFADNVAASSSDRAAVDDAVYEAHIGTAGDGVSWTLPFVQGYNNLDISYHPPLTPVIDDYTYTVLNEPLIWRGSGVQLIKVDAPADGFLRLFIDGVEVPVEALGVALLPASEGLDGREGVVFTLSEEFMLGFGNDVYPVDAMFEDGLAQAPLTVEVDGDGDGDGDGIVGGKTGGVASPGASPSPTGAPKTGDNFGVGVLVSLMILLAAMAGELALFGNRRKRNNSSTL